MTGIRTLMYQSYYSRIVTQARENFSQHQSEQPTIRSSVYQPVAAFMPTETRIPLHYLQ
jgi:hypothetical protein